MQSTQPLQSLAVSDRSGNRRRSTSAPTVGIELGVSGIKLTLAMWRKNKPEIIQTVRRRFPRELTFENADATWLYDQLRQELPPPADSKRLRAVAVLPPALAVYSIQQQTSVTEATRLAAAEMVGGEVELSALGSDTYAAYVCPSQVSQTVAEAIESVGYKCDEVISHPSTLRYAAVLAGEPTAAVLDWGWRGCVLSLPGPQGRETHLTRSFTHCGIHSIIEHATNSLGAPLRMADHFLHDNELSGSATQRRFSDAMRPLLAPAVALVSDNIKQTLRYARRFQIESPSRILICGGSSLLPSLIGLLEDHIGVSIRPWSLASDSSSRPLSSNSESASAVSAAAALMPVDNDLW